MILILKIRVNFRRSPLLTHNDEKLQYCIIYNSHTELNVLVNRRQFLMSEAELAQLMENVKDRNHDVASEALKRFPLPPEHAQMNQEVFQFIVNRWAGFRPEVADAALGAIQRECKAQTCPQNVRTSIIFTFLLNVVQAHKGNGILKCFKMYARYLSNETERNNLITNSKTMLVNYQKHNVLVGTTIMKGMLKGDWKADEAFISFLVDRPAILKVLLRPLVLNIEPHVDAAVVVKLVEDAASALKIGSDVIDTVLTMKTPPPTLIKGVQEFMEDGGLSGLTLRVVLKRWERVHELSIIPTDKLLSALVKGHTFTAENLDVLYNFVVNMSQEEMQTVNKKDLNLFVEKFNKLNIMKGFDVCASVVEKVSFANEEICAFMCKDSTREWRAEWCKAFAVITKNVPKGMRDKLYALVAEDLDNELKYGHISYSDGRRVIQTTPPLSFPVEEAPKFVSVLAGFKTAAPPRPTAPVKPKIGGISSSHSAFGVLLNPMEETKPFVGWRELSQLIALLPKSETTLQRVKSAMELHGRALVKQVAHLLDDYSDTEIVKFVDWLQSRDVPNQVMALEVICTIMKLGHHHGLFDKFLSKICDILVNVSLHPNVRSKAIRSLPVMQEVMPAECTYSMSTALDLLNNVTGDDERYAKMDIGQKVGPTAHRSPPQNSSPSTRITSQSSTVVTTKMTPVTGGMGPRRGTTNMQPNGSGSSFVVNKGPRIWQPKLRGQS